MYRNALVIYHHIRVLKVSVIPGLFVYMYSGVQTLLGSLPSPYTAHVCKLLL
jgi:hypothetical protein